MEFQKFVRELPCPENAVAVFAQRWAAPEGPQVAALWERAFSGDERPLQAARAFGKDGRLDGVSVQELAPLKAAHTYVLEQLGADVLAVEGNAEAFLKCLIVKETMGLRSRFLLGNFIPLLEAGARQEMIFASGVLYHMSDPIRLIRLILEAADKAYFWTHYHDARDKNSRVGHDGKREGLDATDYQAVNVGRAVNSRWWGGLEDFACWMERDAILDACRRFGLRVEVVGETPPGGPSSARFAFVCSR